MKTSTALPCYPEECAQKRNLTLVVLEWIAKLKIEGAEHLSKIK